MPHAKAYTMSTNKTLLGVLVGLAAGAALGVLLAPRSGKETRVILKTKGKKAKDDLADLLDRGFEKWQGTKDTIVERAHMTKDDLKEFLEFMAAEGADLKERIKRDVKGTSGAA